MALALKHEQDDGALLGELARLIEDLRHNRCRTFILHAQDPATMAVEEFSDLFSRHLLYEENLLFPVLREPTPAAGETLEALKEEHGRLRSFARDLVDHVRLKNLEAACETGRIFMAALLDHISREGRVTAALVQRLAPRAAARVRAVLESEQSLDGLE
jgi:hemerythrin-like domain-containing protein